jgi:dTDP-glucose 4,6-dehydratase
MVALITGGAGFIGSHLIAHILANTDWDVVVLDRLDCSGNLARLSDCETYQKHRGRVRFVWHDLKAPISSQIAGQVGPVDYVFHLAASTHVDRSITSPLEFVYDNVVGTAHALEYARQVLPRRFVYFSTDEVFGPAAQGWWPDCAGKQHDQNDRLRPMNLPAYREWDRYNSGNPYSATKAGAEELCLAYHNTYRVPVLITHCMNAFGERQHPEKFIPGTIAKVSRGELVTIHANSDKTKAGSRFYIHARNIAHAVLHILERGSVGDKFNIVGEQEVDNLQLAQLIANIQGKPLRYEMVDFHSSRPGHDLRYSLDGSKLAAMGWKPPVSFEQGLARVVQWTMENPRWLIP